MASDDNGSPLELLATSSPLGTYELQAALYLTRGGSWTAHINGSVAILNKNFSAVHITSDVGGLFQSIVSQMLVIRMSSGLRPTIPIELCEKFGSTGNSAANMFYEMMYETAHFIAEWHEGQSCYDRRRAALIFPPSYQGRSEPRKKTGGMDGITPHFMGCSETRQL